MRLLIVGASGQLGGHLLAQARAAGHAAAGTYATVPRPGLARLALEDGAALEAAVADTLPDAVVLCAGWTWVDANEDDPARSYRVNRDQPLALARAAAAAGADFAFFSTDYVFDGAAGPYDEDAAPRPVSVYGRAKLEAEEGLRALASEGARVLVLRTTTVFGPEAQGKNFAYQALGRLKAGERLVVPDDQLSTPSYGPDVAAATLALLERREAGTWNLAGPDLLDRAAFARLLADVWGLDPALIEGRATAALGQKAARPLRGGLRTDKLRAAGLTIRGARAGLEALRAHLAPGT